MQDSATAAGSPVAHPRQPGKPKPQPQPQHITPHPAPAQPPASSLRSSSSLMFPVPPAWSGQHVSCSSAALCWGLGAVSEVGCGAVCWTELPTGSCGDTTAAVSDKHGLRIAICFGAACSIAQLELIRYHDVCFGLALWVCWVRSMLEHPQAF